jgi:hypothetical protein
VVRDVLLAQIPVIPRRLRRNENWLGLFRALLEVAGELVEGRLQVDGERP